ncbi:MAG: hypothetical protein JHC95_04365 [Solirubrobacteraceae bacterium]|nr:hypothetical protein [Solirubrobacteraceae bacterium]
MLAPYHTALQIRVARPQDADALLRLAGLDSQPPPDPGEHLLAFADDEPIAALALHGTWRAADPFRQSAGALELLEARRAQVTRRPRRRVPRRRLVLARG